MEKIIAEIVMGVLFLSMLVTVIPVYRENEMLVTQAAQQLDYSEKIKEVVTPETENGTWISGSDVIRTIRYYALNGEADVTVYSRKGAKTYSGTDYDETAYALDRAADFYCICSNSNGKKVFIFYEGV